MDCRVKTVLGTHWKVPGRDVSILDLMDCRVKTYLIEVYADSAGSFNP